MSSCFKIILTIFIVISSSFVMADESHQFVSAPSILSVQASRTPTSQDPTKSSDPSFSVKPSSNQRVKSLKGKRGKDKNRSSQAPSLSPSDTGTGAEIIQENHPSSSPSSLIVPSNDQSNIPSSHITDPPSVFIPTRSPLDISDSPSNAPSLDNSEPPSNAPEKSASASPSLKFSNIPSRPPSSHPSDVPSHLLSNNESETPMSYPSAKISSNPTNAVSSPPTEGMTTISPTVRISSHPTYLILSEPSGSPTYIMSSTTPTFSLEYPTVELIPFAMELKHPISLLPLEIAMLTNVTAGFVNNLGNTRVVRSESINEFTDFVVDLNGFQHAITQGDLLWTTLVIFNGTASFDSYHIPSSDALADMIIDFFERDNGEMFIQELSRSGATALSSVEDVTVDIWQGEGSATDVTDSFPPQDSTDEDEDEPTDIQTIMVVVGAVGGFCLATGFALAEKRRRSFAILNNHQIQQQMERKTSASDKSWETDSTQPQARQNNVTFVPQPDDSDSSVCSSIALSHKFSRNFDEESCCTDKFEYIWKSDIDKAIPASPSQSTVVTGNRTPDRSPLMINQADTDGVLPRTSTRRCCINSAF